MCGITSARDAEIAAKVGANFIGMRIWPNSKRSLSTQVASDIVKAAREFGAEPVGVFVDEDADTTLRYSDASDIELVQLYGDGAGAAPPCLLQWRRVVYIMHADETGKLSTRMPDDESFASVDWVLVDNAQGWLLAGGLNPDNVCRAIEILKPHGVDVSSGICASDDELAICERPQENICIYAKSKEWVLSGIVSESGEMLRLSRNKQAKRLYMNRVPDLTFTVADGKNIRMN